MAVPKKKTSKSKKSSRKAIWNYKIVRHFKLALTLLKSSQSGLSKTFIF